MMKSYLRLLLHTFRSLTLILVVVTFGAMITIFGSSITRTGHDPLSETEHGGQSSGKDGLSDAYEFLEEIKDITRKAKAPQHHDVEPDTKYLLNLLREKMTHLRESGYLQTIHKTEACREDESPWGRCIDPNCKTPPTNPLSVVNIEYIRKPVSMVGGTERLWEHTKKFNVNPKKWKYLFLTGASHNHFKETEASIQSLYSNVLPHLTNYSLVYYDLGLKAEEREIVKNFNGIELKDFPFDKFSRTFKFLRGFMWKPLIVLSHLNSAEFVIWMDSSLNFDQDIQTYFVNASYTGILLNRNRFGHAQHTYTKMFSYFAEEACNFAEYGELEGGFLVLHNEPFIRHLVLEPWSACALDEECMCPQETKTMLACNRTIRQYSKCHRFDQSAISLILTKLLRENVESVVIKNRIHSVKRGQNGTFLTDGDVEI